MTLRHYASRFLEEEDRLRFLLSRVMLKLGVDGFEFNRSHYKLVFAPTSTSAVLWHRNGQMTFDESLIRDRLKPGQCFVDVGANIGALTLMAAATVGRSGFVHAIEAHPKTFRYLKRNIAVNNAKNITAYNFAIGETEGSICLSDNTNDDSQNRVSHSSDGLTVPMTTLDALLAEVKRIDFLKIDVEGYELNVLKGARETLARTSQVYFESSDAMCAAFGYKPSDVQDLLLSAGFRICRVSNSQLEEVKGALTSPSYENLLAVRHGTTSSQS